MNNLNSVLIEGNMVRNPLFRSTQKGTSVCNFTIASNRYYKQDKQDTGFEKEIGFFDVETWGKLAEVCSNQGRKGRGVRVVGRLKQDRWTGTDGKNHTKVAIVAEHVEYRPEFKKIADSEALSTEAVEEAAAEAAAEDSMENGEDNIYSGIPVEAAMAEDFRAVTF